jgi:CRISPR-associated protein (Cas_Cmr5).
MESLTDQLLPIAREVLRDAKIKEARSGEQGIWLKNSIIEVYERYATAFPIIIDQSGLRTAVAIYSSEREIGEGNRKLLLGLLYNILNEAGLMDRENSDSLIEAILDDKDGDLTTHYEEFLIQAAIALKRAMRTFSLIKN